VSRHGIPDGLQADARWSLHNTREISAESFAVDRGPQSPGYKAAAASVAAGPCGFAPQLQTTSESRNGHPAVSLTRSIVHEVLAVANGSVGSVTAAGVCRAVRGRPELGAKIKTD
jgi:hypothetical protein